MENEHFIIKDEFREIVEKYYLHEEKDYKCAACGEGTLWLAQSNAYLRGYNRAIENMRAYLMNHKKEEV